MSVYVWPALLFTWLFCMGACIGSFLNVCIARMPSRRTPCWPGSHCLSCFQAIALRDNIPLLSYWLLGGQCRRCHASFSMRYFWIEFTTACLFSVYYFLDIGFNLHGYEQFGKWGLWYLQAALFPPWSWPLFIIHALMLSFLITAALIQWEQGRPNRPVLVRGCLLGLLISAIFPWPFPYDWSQAVIVDGRTPHSFSGNVSDAMIWLTPHPGPMPLDASWATTFYSPRIGFTPWPVFGPLPDWLPGPLQGLLTGLAGCGLGLLLREIGRGRWSKRPRAEVAAADFDDGGVLAIAGCYLGWQPVLVGAAVAYVVGIGWKLASRRAPLPFGLLTGITLLVFWMAWTWLAALLAPICFDPVRAFIAIAIVSGLAFFAAKLPPRAVGGESIALATEHTENAERKQQLESRLDKARTETFLLDDKEIVN
jgi:leader peptidase (prepilin peptidase)/N-methyltransferase